MPPSTRSSSLLRHSDGLLIGMSAIHGMLLLSFPSIWLIGVGMWWNANTVAHNFIHLPFFRSRALNRLFSAYLTMLLGVPQNLWRQRHLAHHAERSWHFRWNTQLATEVGVLLVIWLLLLILVPMFFVTTYLPGVALGLGLCALQGRYEHVGGTVSHYSRLYNWLFFNDGYHVEHHRRPAVHWRELPAHREMKAVASRWPAVLRWLDVWSLTSLEKMALKSRMLQRFVLTRHERAFRRLWSELKQVGNITVIGGALFPRTALILQRLAPQAGIEVIDCCRDHILRASRLVGPEIRFTEQFFHSSDASHYAQNLLVIPLSYRGDKAELCRNAAGPVMVHDWVWRRRGTGVVVSWLLLKRLNLVQPCSH